MTDDSNPTADETTDAEAPAASYAEATAEIDAILTELERDDLDVDLLAVQVRRAATLLAWCRGRIRLAADDIADVVGTLGDDPDSTSETGSDSED